MQKTIVFIHGAWVTPKCWEKFLPYFEAQGYRCLAPAWPFKDTPVAEQRQRPNPNLAGLGIAEIVGHYEKIIRQMQQPPILIGHSFGGMFVQILLDRSLGAAGVAINSAPPKGVFSFYPTVLKSLRYPLMQPFGWRKILRWPFQHFRYAFVDTMPLAQAEQAYNDYVVPEAGRIFWQAAFEPFNSVAAINFKNQNRAPLLLVAGSADKICPAKVNYANYKQYLAANPQARVSYKEFPNRTHWIIAQDGWEEVAATINAWLSATA